MGESLTERCRVVDEVLRHVNTFYEGESCRITWDVMRICKLKISICKEIQNTKTQTIAILEIKVWILFANCKLSIANFASRFA